MLKEIDLVSQITLLHWTNATIYNSLWPPVFGSATWLCSVPLINFFMRGMCLLRAHLDINEGGRSSVFVGKEINNRHRMNSLFIYAYLFINHHHHLLFNRHQKF
jgi:hypothetical protein